MASHQNNTDTYTLNIDTYTLIQYIECTDADNLSTY